ncbi:MAG: AAA family ATPase [Clostridiales bacterium]|nr:AAA family ATPase [Clostridiales bacterium]
MNELTAFAQLVFTIIVGMYFFLHLRTDSESERLVKDEAKDQAEGVNALRHISLNEPMTELSRPCATSEIIGQEEGVRALRAALWGANPQHVLIYGPPGVGKTAAARVVLEEIKKSPGTPFAKDAAFVETDACVMRCDERGFADPLIGSVHDPIYQGAGAYGNSGIPQPKAGAVTKAHGGILFLDEIGELPNEQLNKLLKVLEDRRVMLESSYYSRRNRKIPTYIHDIFQNGLPADFRLIGATTRKPQDIPEAVRSRCVEIYFSALSRSDIVKIVAEAALRCGVAAENGVKETIADYAANGRDAVKLLQSAANLARMEGRPVVTVSDAVWVAKAGRYKKREEPFLKGNEKIVDISIIKPK